MSYSSYQIEEQTPDSWDTKIHKTKILFILSTPQQNYIIFPNLNYKNARLQSKLIGNKSITMYF
jgi:hypothetical protein